jgi:5-oxoprolinase (ATP-hydrolysing)
MIDKYWNIWIDTGGTFTDCIAHDPDGHRYSLKVLSKSALRGRIIKQIDSTKYKIIVHWSEFQNIFKGYDFKILGINHRSVKIETTDFSKNILDLNKPIGVKLGDFVDFEISSGEEAPILASRLVTGTPLDKALPPIQMRLGSTIGTNALLERKGANTLLLVTKGYKDLLLIGNQQRPNIFSLQIPNKNPFYTRVEEIAERISSKGKLIDPINESEISSLINSIEEDNIESIAISFLHSYLNPEHEQKILQKIKNTGFQYVTSSFDIAPVINYLNRTETSTVNAYLEPKVRSYLKKVFENLDKGELRVMTSAGGLADYNHFLPKDSLFSGPAGGIVGAVDAAGRINKSKILSFDMGGTSTDVARYDNKYEYQYETKIGDATIVSPSLNIETVASGGGSVCKYDGIKFTIGPESAGSAPGPACYGANGPLTITDVNLLLGRLDENNFGIPVNRKWSQKAFDSLTENFLINVKDQELILEGFLQIANEKMATAIRKISINKGYDPSEYTLVSFGGAGGQHACDIARILNINEILIPYNASLLSAAGMGNARIERFSIKQILRPLTQLAHELDPIIDQCGKDAVRKLLNENIPIDDIYIRETLIYLRFMGQEATLEISYEKQDILKAFQKKYEKIYGHWIKNREIEVESIKVIATEKRGRKKLIDKSLTSYNPDPHRYQKAYFDGTWEEVPVYYWEQMNPGAQIIGPALLISKFTAIVVKSNWKLEINNYNQSVIQYEKEFSVEFNSNKDQHKYDQSIHIELFTNRFFSLAEDMGALLQRTSFSVNIKERLDYSCALLDSEGYLIVNAPHIPVHLGGLGLCVRSIISKFQVEPDQVFITNHPGFGGSHLPDITLVAPVFDDHQNLIGFVANRAHHAELGGKRPGSMPPDASSLGEEGKVISPTFLLKNNEAFWGEIQDILSGNPYPTRCIEENIADLTGALASIKNGSDNLRKLCRMYGSSTIKYYMDYLKDYANQRLLKNLKKLKSNFFTATESLDDGHIIQVSIVISDNRLVFDFSGSSTLHPGNLNATPAIVRSAVLYVLRLLVNENIPLNEGLMRSVDIKLPRGFLNPEFPDDINKCPAVVGGNTETSQRLVDTLLKAFNLAACSQGTMNNFLFGNDSFSYYETIGGGVGATPNHHGASAVHQHMTNTRITDPEILEFRYPVRLNEFSIRKRSGGEGKWIGGEGIIRKITFLDSLEMTILSQHRVTAPYALNGGKRGRKGKQILTRADGSMEELYGIDARQVYPGDSITIMTPGGGGYGDPDK